MTGLVQQENAIGRDQAITCGRAILVPHDDGGWAIPGGGHAKTLAEARIAVLEIDWLLKTLEG